MTSTNMAPALTLADFDYPLPEALIARYPLAERDASRMLVVDRQRETLTDASFSDFPNYCDAGDVVVVNNAKVLPVRLLGHREGFTGTVEVFLMHPQNEARTDWLALTRPARKLKPGTRICFDGSPLVVEIQETRDEGQARVHLDWPDTQTLEEVLGTTGVLPLPPYLNRSAETSDNDRYQTVYAKTPGAQAAPTAGLHFTPAIFERLRERGVFVLEVSLMVSAGTFRPVVTEDIHQHNMAAEAYELSADVAKQINQAKQEGRRIIGIGTTSVKTLETVAHKHSGKLCESSGWSDLFITPGFSFQIADRMLTNFHLPKSTLLMMVSAFSERERILRAYHHAIEEKYRFYSYGDCMLLL